MSDLRAQLRLGYRLYRPGRRCSRYLLRAVHGHGPAPEAWIDVVVGSWDAPFLDHATFSIRVAEEGAGVVDAPVSSKGQAPFAGRKLTRDAASGIRKWTRSGRSWTSLSTPIPLSAVACSSVGTDDPVGVEPDWVRPSGTVSTARGQELRAIVQRMPQPLARRWQSHRGAERRAGEAPRRWGARRLASRRQLGDEPRTRIVLHGVHAPVLPFQFIACPDAHGDGPEFVGYVIEDSLGDGPILV